jgi:hypothetical protein
MKFCEEKCEVGDARCSRNSSRKQLIYELLWFSRIRDQLALFLEIRSSLYSLSFIWSRDDFERLSPRDVENEKRRFSKTLLGTLIHDSVFACQKRDQI